MENNQNVTDAVKHFNIPNFELDLDDSAFAYQSERLSVAQGSDVTVAKAARYHPVHKEIEPHFSLSCYENLIKIRCTALDFDDSALKPQPLNASYITIDRKKAIISEVQKG